MKIQPECLPCLIKRCLYEIELAGKNREVSKKAMVKAMETLAREFDPSRCSASIATDVHRAVYQTLDCKDPYREMKRRSNEVALSLLPKVEAIIKNSRDPLKAAIVCSIIGNILDFGIKGGSSRPENLEKDFERFYREGLGYSDYDEFRKLLLNARRVTLFTDNCGEIVFDKLLCREIKRLKPELKLTLVVKGEPVLSDATREDAENLSFREVVDEIMDTGTFAVGLDIENMPENLRKNLEETDLIICKGMANYEVFSETSYRPIVYLLRTKCEPIARSIGVKTNISILKLFTQK